MNDTVKEIYKYMIQVGPDDKIFMFWVKREERFNATISRKEYCKELLNTLWIRE